jgi:predicted TIM-barrel fold metal-dependent hydrolase
MIVDAHLHAFPHIGGASGYADAATHVAMHQGKVEGWWGRMVTSTLDERHMPCAGEAVDFRVGRFGRYTWRKAGRDCWLQRFPLTLEEIEWSPERMVANMDAVGVAVGVLQAGYMEINFCRDYFAQCVAKFPDRLISTVAIDYDIACDEAYRMAELDKLRHAVAGQNARGVYQGYPKGRPEDDPRFEPFWRLLGELGIPHILQTGFEPAARYLDSLKRLEMVARRFPETRLVIGHLGGNVRHPSHPGHTGTPDELMPLLRLPNVFFEVGYVLAYENVEVWGRDYEYPYPRHQALIRRIYDQIGADRLVWGSDMPNVERTCTYLQCLDLVRLHFDFMSEAEKQRVLGGTAAGLFGIAPAMTDHSPAPAPARVVERAGS